MNNDDGHSPETCGWQKCEGSKDTPCPFLRDPGFMTLPPLGCKHEWRQILGDAPGMNFYCVYCLKVKKAEKDDII